MRASRAPQRGPSPASGQTVQALPAPRDRGSLSLEEALARRRSQRFFAARLLTDAEISQLLWAASGITSKDGYHTAPSAGALYPLEWYLVTARGLAHFEPRGHRLAWIMEGDVRHALGETALSQDAVGGAPAVFVVTAVVSRTVVKYGEGRARRYVHLEAGHAAQNLLLQAVALGLGAVPVGAFHDRRVQQVLGLPDDREPLYLIPVGAPRE